MRGRRASILVLEGIRNRRAACHPESRAIPTDDSHAFPFFEEFLQPPQLQGSLRLNLAHRHPITPILPSQIACGIEDDIQQRLSSEEIKNCSSKHHHHDQLTCTRRDAQSAPTNYSAMARVTKKVKRNSEEIAPKRETTATQTHNRNTNTQPQQQQHPATATQQQPATATEQQKQRQHKTEKKTTRTETEARQRKRREEKRRREERRGEERGEERRGSEDERGERKGTYDENPVFLKHKKAVASGKSACHTFKIQKYYIFQKKTANCETPLSTVCNFLSSTTISLLIRLIFEAHGERPTRPKITYTMVSLVVRLVEKEPFDSPRRLSCSSPLSGLSGLRWVFSDPDLFQRFWTAPSAIGNIIFSSHHVPFRPQRPPLHAMYHHHVMCFHER